MANISLAGCIIYNDYGDVLMLHRNTAHRTQWEIPGGGVDAGEDADVAATREVLEELGVTVRIVRELGHREFSEDGNDFDYTWFQAEIINGEPGIKEPQAYDKFGYLSLVTLTRRYDELSANTKNFLEAIAYGEIDIE
jgi:8-oxo-dGTP pyrophosphatase MutT (NUDIX family)